MGRTDENFCRMLEQKAVNTIKKYSKLPKTASVLVACSGGKDSTAALYMSSKYFKNITAIAIDEEIAGYEKQLQELEQLCNRLGVKLIKTSFSQEFGAPLPEIVKKTGMSPCSACGILKRWLINRKASDYDCVITGHNLEDETEAVLMNLLKSNMRELKSQRPYLEELKNYGLTPRLKPLYFISEEDIRKYVRARGLPFLEKACPNRRDAFRHSVEDELKRLKFRNPKILEHIIRAHLKTIEKMNGPTEKIMRCRTCGMPSQQEECRACSIISKMRAE